MELVEQADPDRFVALRRPKSCTADRDGGLQVLEVLARAESRQPRRGQVRAVGSRLRVVLRQGSQGVAVEQYRRVRQLDVRRLREGEKQSGSLSVADRTIVETRTVPSFPALLDGGAQLGRYVFRVRGVKRVEQLHRDGQIASPLISSIPEKEVPVPMEQ
ncbi:hypothetical protein ACFWHL_36020 [Streptomyces massasporeus]